MKTTIDAAGRIVVPKALRDALALTAGQDLEIGLADGRITIDVPATEMSLVDRGDGPVAITDREMPSLTAALVRDVLEQIRR